MTVTVLCLNEQRLQQAGTDVSGGKSSDWAKKSGRAIQEYSTFVESGSSDDNSVAIGQVRCEREGQCPVHEEVRLR